MGLLQPAGYKFSRLLTPVAVTSNMRHVWRHVARALERSQPFQRQRR